MALARHRVGAPAWCRPGYFLAARKSSPLTLGHSCSLPTPTTSLRGNDHGGPDQGVPVPTPLGTSISAVPRPENQNCAYMTLLFWSPRLCQINVKTSVCGCRARDQGGILVWVRRLCSCLQMSNQTTEDMAWHIVLKVLPPYLVYHSFRAALLPFVDDCHHERISVPSSLKKAFEPLSLLDAALEPTRRASGGCDNLQCHRFDTQISLKACQVARYCSQACQKSDWKAGHREACKLMECDSALGRRRYCDMSGVRDLAQHFSDYNFATLQAIAEGDFPDTPHEDLVPCIDFTEYPKIAYKVAIIGGELVSDEFRPIAEACRAVGVTFVIALKRNGTMTKLAWAASAKPDFWTNKAPYSVIQSTIEGDSNSSREA
ncbi:hypothetical protein FB45DRAFT_1004653 [Roridomyces roridus]|uniref:MYND-type domain-containing protein n=1 Tax=Roridomyces roridus TaxID=1738132 RepID=A0AAD7BQF5_9AGAR|nr:hypothetical protein FB45DRAFT_1004653 [Roridomyces roridus]